MPLRGARGGRDCSPAMSVSSGGSWSSACSVGVAGASGVDLVVAGRRYTRARANADGSVRWACATRGCPASLRTDAKGVVLLRRGARHRCALPPPPDRQGAGAARLAALSADEAAASGSDAEASDNLPLSRRLLPAPTGPSGWPLLHPVNPYLTCGLCSGYLIDATTIVDCMHSFCRSCIILHLRSNSFCPTCEQILRRFDPPLHGLRRDHTLQTLVYKMVPGLYRKERERRKVFGQQDPQQPRLPKPAKNILTDEEKINIALQYDECVENDAGDIYKQDKETKRYLKCPAAVRIRYLQHFIRMKYGLSDAHRVDIIYNDECLPHTFTLKDVIYIFSLDKYKTVEFGFRIYLQDPAELNKSAQNASVQKKGRRPYKRKQTMKKKQAVASTRSKLSRSQSTPNVSVCIESPEPSSIVPAESEEYDVTTKSRRGRGRGRGRRARSGTRKDKNSFASLDDDLLRAGHLFEMEFDSIASTSNYQGNCATDYEDLNHQINDAKSASPKSVTDQTGALLKDNNGLNMPFAPVTFSHGEACTIEVGLPDATRDNVFCMEDTPRTPGESSQIKFSETKEDNAGEVISDSRKEGISISESAMLSPKHECFYSSCSPNNESSPSQQICISGKLVPTRRQSRTVLSPPRISSSKCNNSDVFDSRHNSQGSVREQFCDSSNLNNVLKQEGSVLSSICSNRSPSVVGIVEQKGGKVDGNAQIHTNCQQNVSLLNSDNTVREEKCPDGTEYVPASKRLCVEQEQSSELSNNVGEGKSSLEGPEVTGGNKVDTKICANETQNAKFKTGGAVNASINSCETERTEVNNGFRRMTNKINNNMELISKHLGQKFSASSKQKTNARCRDKVMKQKRMPLKGTALFKTLEPLSSSLHRKCLVSKVYGLVGFRNMNWNKGRCKTKDTSRKGRKRRIMHSVLIKKFDMDYDNATHSSSEISNVVAPQSLEEKTELHDPSPLHRDTCKTCQNNQSSTVIWKKVVTPSRKRRFSETIEKSDKEQVTGGKVNGLTVTGVRATEHSGETDSGSVKTINVVENEIINKTHDSIICKDSSLSAPLSSLQNHTGTASLVINNSKQTNSHSLGTENLDGTNISNSHSISGKTSQSEIKSSNIQHNQVVSAPPITNSSKITTDNTMKNEIVQCKESSKKETSMSSKESTSSNKSSKGGDKDSNYSDKSSNYSEFDEFSEEDELILRVSEHEDDEVTSRVSDHEDDEIMSENLGQSLEVQKGINEDKTVRDEPKNNSNKISETSDSSETKSKEGGQKIPQVPLPASHELKDVERISKEKGAESKSGQKSWSETYRPDKVPSHKTVSSYHSINNRTGSSISPVSSSNSSQHCAPKGSNSNAVIPQTAANKTDKKPKGGNLYELTMKPKENTIVPPPSITISRLNSNLKPKQRADTSNSTKNKRPSLEILPVKPSGTQQSATDRSKKLGLGSPYFTPKRKPANMPLLKPPQLLQNTASQAHNYPTETVTKNGLQIIPTSSKNEAVSSSSRKSSVTTTSVSNSANNKSSENAANKNTRGGEAVLDLSEKSTRYKGSSPEPLNQSPNEIQPPKSFVTATQIAQNRASLCSTLASNFQHFQHHFSAKTPPQNLPQAGIASALGTALSSALRGTLTSSQAARGIPNDVMHPAAANSSFLVNRNTLSGASMQYCNAKDETEKSVKQQLYQNIQQKSKAAHTATATSSQNVNNQMMYGRNMRMQSGVHMGHVHTSSVCYPESSPNGPKEYPDPRSPIPLSPTTPVSSPLSPTHQAMANFGCLSPTYNPHPLYKSFASASSEIVYDRAKRNLMPEHRNPGPSQTVRHIPNPSTLQFRQQRRNSPSSAPPNVPSSSANNSLSSKMPFLHQRLLEASNSASKSVSATSTSSTLTLNSGNFVSHDKSKPSRRNSANK